MSTLYLTIGPPAAGKTTFVSWELVARGHVRAVDVLSPDALLFQGEDYVWSPQAAGRAWAATNRAFQVLLETGRDLVIDATFARARDRAPYVAAAHRAGYRVVAIYFDVPADVLLERDRQRRTGRSVGVEVIERHRAALQPPGPEEGFDEIRRIGLADQPEEP